MRKEANKSVFSEKMARALSIFSLAIIFLLGLVGLAVGFAWNKSQPLQAGIAFGVSSSLIGYVLTTGFHSWTASLTARRVLEEALQVQLRETVRDIQAEAYFQVAQQFPKLLPSNYFPPTNVSSPDFENELAAAISNSRNYFFRGVTARHVPVYLRRLKPTNLHAHILVLDPREIQQLMLYSMYRFGEAGAEVADRKGLVDRVQREMYYSIVGLYDVAHICPMSVRLHRGPVFYRSEIMDDKCFIAFYVGARTTYAVTYAYDRGSFFYEAFYKDALHILQIDSPAMEMNGMTSEEDLAMFLKSMGCDIPISDLRKEFNEFEVKFNARS